MNKNSDYQSNNQTNKNRSNHVEFADEIDANMDKNTNRQTDKNTNHNTDKNTNRSTDKNCD